MCVLGAFCRPKKSRLLTERGFFIAQSHSEATMTKKANPAKRGTREHMDNRTPDEQDPDECPMTSEQALRELGHDWLPFNGTVGEDD